MLRRTLALLALLCLALASPFVVARSTAASNAPDGAGGGGFNFGALDHLSPQVARAIDEEIAQNAARLTAEGRLPQPAHPAQTLFAWPLTANDPADFDYHAVANFVDHDPAYPNHVLDYNGGDRTYDTSDGYNHSGTDFILWPFPWLKMQNNVVQAVAAAPGVIVGKDDGYADHDCSFTGSTPNALYVQQGDGSVAWYLHLKKGSLTPKQVGDAIATGEYVGDVGSSGDSTTPHLHFEVRDGWSNHSHVIDPWYGPSNPSVTSSWWQAQPPYYDSAINHVGASTSAPHFPPCPQVETPNESGQFAPGTRVYFTAYYHDQLDTQETDYQLLKPDGSVYRSGSLLSDAPYYTISYWYWDFLLGPSLPQGAWVFRLTYEGRTYDHPFLLGGVPLYLPMVVR